MHGPGSPARPCMPTRPAGPTAAASLTPAHRLAWSGRRSTACLPGCGLGAGPHVGAGACSCCCCCCRHSRRRRRRLQVRIGAYEGSPVPAVPGPASYESRQVIAVAVHAGYDSGTMDNDLALLLLDHGSFKSPITPTSGARPVCPAVLCALLGARCPAGQADHPIAAARAARPPARPRRPRVHAAERARGWQGAGHRLGVHQL